MNFLLNMTLQTQELIKEVKDLPIDQQLLVVEELIKSIKLRNQLEYAVNELKAEYETNKDLVAFTSIDLDGFYETR